VLARRAPLARGFPAGADGTVGYPDGANRHRHHGDDAGTDAASDDPVAPASLPGAVLDG
jgi:hypothetical protein